MSIDWQILHFIRDYMHTDIGDSFFPLITTMADKGMLWIIIGLMLLCIKEYRLAGVCMLLAMLMTTVIGNEIIKELVERPRPFVVEQVTDLLIPIPDEYSFPSGHSSASAAAATILWRTRNRALGIFSVVLALIIMFSRMYCYVHFPSDVLAGALLGVAIAWIIDVAAKKVVEARTRS